MANCLTRGSGMAEGDQPLLELTPLAPLPPSADCQHARHAVPVSSGEASAAPLEALRSNYVASAEMTHAHAQCTMQAIEHISAGDEWGHNSNVVRQMQRLKKSTVNTMRSQVEQLREAAQKGKLADGQIADVLKNSKLRQRLKDYKDIEEKAILRQRDRMRQQASSLVELQGENRIWNEEHFDSMMDLASTGIGVFRTATKRMLVQNVKQARAQRDLAELAVKAEAFKQGSAQLDAAETWKNQQVWRDTEFEVKLNNNAEARDQEQHQGKGDQQGGDHGGQRSRRNAVRRESTLAKLLKPVSLDAPPCDADGADDADAASEVDEVHVPTSPAQEMTLDYDGEQEREDDMYLNRMGLTMSAVPQPPMIGQQQLSVEVPLTSCLGPPDGLSAPSERSNACSFVQPIPLSSMQNHAGSTVRDAATPRGTPMVSSRSPMVSSRSNVINSNVVYANVQSPVAALLHGGGYMQGGGYMHGGGYTAHSASNSHLGPPLQRGASTVCNRSNYPPNPSLQRAAPVSHGVKNWPKPSPTGGGVAPTRMSMPTR